MTRSALSAIACQAYARSWSCRPTWRGAAAGRSDWYRRRRVRSSGAARSTRQAPTRGRRSTSTGRRPDAAIGPAGATLEHLAAPATRARTVTGSCHTKSPYWWPAASRGGSSTPLLKDGQFLLRGQCMTIISISASRVYPEYGSYSASDTSRRHARPPATPSTTITLHLQWSHFLSPVRRFHPIESTFPNCLAHLMQVRVAYEHSLIDAPDDFIVQVPSQLIDDVPANVPPVLLPEYLTDLILKRSPQIGKIRNLRLL